MLAGVSSYLHLLVEPKFKAFHKRYRGRSFKLLDVGCGNHSPTRTLGIFPQCEYHGVDRELYNNSEADLRAMHSFYRLDLTDSDLSAIPDGNFDVILAYHVLEHIPNGHQVVALLCRKLAPGGVIYLEFPSVRSLALPSVAGTLNFCDDAGHVRLYDVKEIANVLLAQGVTILRGGARRDLFGILITPLFYVYLKYLKRCSAASALWDITGFADCILAQKPRDGEPRARVGEP